MNKRIIFVSALLTVGSAQAYEQFLGRASGGGPASYQDIAAEDVQTGTIVHERGGLEADVSAYDGVVTISSGSTSAKALAGSDAAVLTGTAGTSGNCAEWNADGDLVDSGGVCGGGSGAPTDADYLVGTANGSLSAEIVVGTSPGGELGGTWASPTIDATHSGSAHHDAVTVSGTPDYLTLSGQDLVRGTVDISDDTNLAVTAPVVLTGDTVSVTKSGADGTLISGTAGSTGNCAEWDANGDLIDSGGVCGGGSVNSFQTHDAPAGTDPVASSATDTITWTVTSPLVLTGDSGTDTMAFSWSGTFADAQIAESNVTQHEAAIDAVGTIASGVWQGTAIADTYVADDITASNYLLLAGGTLTGELVADELGIEFQETDTITDCSGFAATGGGIFYDDSEGIFKKCQDNVLTDLDTGGAETNNLETTMTGVATGEIVYGSSADTGTYAKISALTEETAPTGGDWLLCEESGGNIRKCDIGDLPSSTGDVSGPASSTDNAVARFDGAGGKTIQDSEVTIEDATGNITTPGSMVFEERSTEGKSPSPGIGQIWVKNDAPNTLYFTNDDGTDFQLGVSGSGDISAVGDCATGACFEGTDGNELTFLEGANHVSTPAPGEGYLWVRNDTPNVLVFTDDDGTDTVLGSGGSEVNALETDGASGIADTEIFIGTGAGTGNYAAMSGDVTLANTGAATVVSASTTTAGKVELATTAETTTGTDATRAVTPDGLQDGYQGSANVTTLGTIGTGTWQGTAVADTYVANDLTIAGGTIGTSTITLQDANGAAPTTDGEIKYDRTTERIEVGDGAGTSEFVKVGTLTDTQYCTWDNANNEIDCNSSPSGSGDITDVGPGCATGACLTDGTATTGTSMFVWEGTSADTNELTIAAPANPAVDQTFTFPDDNIASGDLIVGSGAGTFVYTAKSAVSLSDFDNDLTEIIWFAVSDESTDLATGTGKFTAELPQAFTIDTTKDSGIGCSVVTAPTTSGITVDVNEAGTSIMTTNKISIDATENNSQDAGTAPGVTDTALAKGSSITIDIDAVGSGTAGAGLKCWIIGTWG